MGRSKKWIGTLTKDLRSVASFLKKGDKVECKRYKCNERKDGWDYHYSGINREGFVRTDEFLIKEYL